MGYKPKLRFKEFTEGWEEKELGDISEITMGQSPSSKYYTENHDDTILIQGNADLICGNVVPRIFTTEITKKSDPNDIIMTVRAPVGDLAINKFKACIGRGVCAIKSHFFIYFFLQHFKLENKWVKYSQGSTIDAVSSKDIKNLKIRIPSIKEQEKIAKFLSKVDEKIAILESKHQLWNSYKKGIMQQIFSQKLRFKDEKGNSYSDWEKKRLGEVGVIITGNTPSTKNKNNFANGKYIWVTPTDIGNSRI
ncbi:MAG: restriction endonuclease subunit S, partial [Methanobrevibacter sp.]|nr:restriction endonuclease subunit S [Candidatus Methanovirga meridionalis]